MCDEEPLEDPYLTLKDSGNLDYGLYGNPYLKSGLMMGGHLQEEIPYSLQESHHLP